MNSTENDGIVKGIELKPELNNKAVAEIAIPSTSTSYTNSRSNNKEKVNCENLIFFKNSRLIE
jgi:hypothetical protein